jgi:hypothetical protein
VGVDVFGSHVATIASGFEAGGAPVTLPLPAPEHSPAVA